MAKQKEDKKNLGESVRQRLKNLAKERQRPFDELLRYYAMERFLFRLSISAHASKFFLKGGLMLKVWNELDHRATMDIDLLAGTSNRIENLQAIIVDVASIACSGDAMLYNTSNLILRETQTGGNYQGVCASFSAQLHTARIPLIIDIGFNDCVIPAPAKIDYPTLLDMERPQLMGYTPETVFAEKLESIVKLSMINTRMKDFYDLWTLSRAELNLPILRKAIETVFENRGTPLSFPIVSFTSEFYDAPRTQQLWKAFLKGLGREDPELKIVVSDLQAYVEGFLLPTSQG